MPEDVYKPPGFSKRSIGAIKVSSKVIEINRSDSVKHVSRTTCVVEIFSRFNGSHSFQTRNIVGRISAKDLTSECQMPVPG